MNRRDLHRLLGTVFLGGPLLEHLERWLTVPTRAPAPSHNRALGSTIGAQEVDELEDAARLFRDWDDRFGGGLRRKAVIGQLNEVSELLPDTAPGPLRKRLYAVMAQLAETAAMMSWDSGLQSMAQRYYILAIRAAREGGDSAFAANAMAAMARQLLYMGHPADALEIVRLARTTADDIAGPRLRSMLAVREAWAYAHLGRRTAFERTISAAEIALDGASRGDDEPYWIQYFDAAELNGTIGGRMLEVAQKGGKGAASQAVERIQTALGSRADGRLRSSALDLIGLAQAHMLSGDLDEGARIGAKALDAAGSTSSDRVRVMLAGFHKETDAYVGSSAVRDLRTRVAGALSAGSA